jgi:hypothetical protein
MILGSCGFIQAPTVGKTVTPPVAMMNLEVLVQPLSPTCGPQWTICNKDTPHVAHRQEDLALQRSTDAPYEQM